MDVRNLIDLAAAKLGTRAALAQALDQPPQAVSNWASGRPCPIVVQARIAELAGVDPKQHVWEVVRKQMGKGAKRATLGVAAMLAFGYGGGAQHAEAAGPHRAETTATMYIRRISARAKRLLSTRARLGR